MLRWFEAFLGISTKPGGSRSQWNRYLGLGIIAGIGAVALHTTDNARWREFSAGFILAGASLLVGLLVGFLFGIPKTGKPEEDTVSTRASQIDTSYRLNTNLEDISDWLTKMLIGVGLVQLTSMPGYIKRVSAYWEASVGGSFPGAYVAGLIVFFTCIGFLIGYLWTRLALTGDFMDQDPSRMENIAKKMMAQQREDSSTPIRNLATRYDLMSGQPGGENSTPEQQSIARQLQDLAPGIEDWLEDFMRSQSAGERLAAIALLEKKPEAQHFQWLAERFPAEDPFLLHHAALALRNAVQPGSPQSYSTALRQAVLSALDRAISLTPSQTEGAAVNELPSVVVLRQALQLLGEAEEGGQG